MGNLSAKLKASENTGGLLDSLKAGMQKAHGAGDTSDPNVVISAGEKTEQPAKPVDPMTIASSLTSFPGTFNEIHKVKEVFPMAFDGIRATFNKGLSSHFQVSHSFSLGFMQPSAYKFGATYAGTKQLSQSEAFPILLGEMDPNGNLTAQCIHAFTPKTRSRLVAQIQDNKFQALEMTTDYRTDKTTSTFTMANPDLLAGTGVFVAQYLQAVTPRLALGAEILAHRAIRPPGLLSKQCANSFVARYKADNWEAGLQLSPMDLGIHASYYHKLTENQTLGVELEGKGAQGEAVSTVGYSFDIPGADCNIKAQLDTNLNISTTIEKKMLPLPMNIVFCVQGNQKKAQYVCGMGLTVG